MPQIIQPLVVSSQQLIVDSDENIMEAMNEPDEKQLFSKRLSELCDEKELPVYGRQSILRKEFNVSQEATRKWLEGESTPRHSHKVKLCKYFNVNYEWLSTGVGPKYSADKPDQLHDILGVDPDTLDVDQIEIIRYAIQVKKENRPHLKKVIGTYIDDAEPKDEEINK